MEKPENKPVKFSVRKQFALITIILALIYIVGSTFFISAPQNDEKLALGTIGLIQVDAPACPSRWLTGVPCPLCGITTSSMRFFDGDIAGSFDAHPLGPIFATLAILSIPFNLWVLWSGEPEKELDDDKRRSRNRKIAMSVIVIVLIAWIFTLMKFFGLFNSGA